MKIIKTVLVVLTLSVLGALLAPQAGADDWNKKTVMTFTQPVEIPGQVLPAGTYTMTVQTSSNEAPPIDIQGRLNSVRLSSSGSVVLNIGNIGEVAPTAITAFNGKSSTATQSSI